MRLYKFSYAFFLLVMHIINFRLRIWLLLWMIKGLTHLGCYLNFGTCIWLNIITICHWNIRICSKHLGNHRCSERTKEDFGQRPDIGQKVTTVLHLPKLWYFTRQITTGNIITAIMYRELERSKFAYSWKYVLLSPTCPGKTHCSSNVLCTR